MMKLLQTFLFTTTFAVLLAGALVLEVPSAQAQGTDPAPTQQSNQQLDESGQRVNIPEKLQFGTIAGWVYDALKTIGGLFAYLGGSLLDISLSLFVMDMPGTAESWGIKTVIDEIWKMVRDMFNLLFIFGIIFVGFKLILGTDETGAKRTLGTIIIAALLINFSLYATKVVVDFGNIVATEMATLLKTESPENSTGTNTENEIGGLKITNISDSFVTKINPEQIVNNSFALERSAIEKAEGTIALKNAKKTELDLMHALIMGLTTAFTLTLVGFVFAAGAFLMFTRFMYLIFLMMFSPIMFLGFVLPNFKKRSSDWWHKLFTQTLICPAYLFMLYIALKSLENIGDIQSDSTLISYVMLCIVVCGFAWAALLVANSMGAMGADTAIKLGSGWGKSIRGGVTGFAGRNTIGRVADNWNRNAEKRGISEQNVFRRVSSNLAGSKFGGSASRTQVRTAQEKADQKGARHTQLTNINTAIAGAGVGTTEDQVRASNVAMERAVVGASNDQIVELLGEHKAGSKEYETIVRNMSASQFDAAMKAKPEELDDSAKDQMAKRRAEFVKQAIVSDEKATDAAAVNAGMTANIKNVSDAKLKVLGTEE